MGTRFRQVFEDDKFLPSINAAKWRTYEACLSDLTVFVAATSGLENRLKTDEIAELARHCFATAVGQTFDDAEAGTPRPEIIVKFDQRSKSIQWTNAAIGENAFTTSPEELIQSAPIANELKQHDEEIVTNSIRFRWRDGQIWQ